MQHLLQELTPLISHYGLLIVFIGMILEGTTMILATGILVHLGYLSFSGALGVAILGAILGDQLWYTLGKYAISKVLSFLPSFAQHMQKLKERIDHNGHWLALTSRFIYGGAILFPLSLGNYRYPYTKFALFDAFGATLWALSGITIGYYLSNTLQHLGYEIHTAEHLFLYALVAGIAIWWLRKRFFAH